MCPFPWASTVAPCFWTHIWSLNCGSMGNRSRPSPAQSAKMLAVSFASKWFPLHSCSLFISIEISKLKTCTVASRQWSIQFFGATVCVTGAIVRCWLWERAKETEIFPAKNVIFTEELAQIHSQALGGFCFPQSLCSPTSEQSHTHWGAQCEEQYRGLSTKTRKITSLSNFS